MKNHKRFCGWQSLCQPLLLLGQLNIAPVINILTPGRARAAVTGPRRSDKTYCRSLQMASFFSLNNTLLDRHSPSW